MRPRGRVAEAEIGDLEDVARSSAARRARIERGAERVAEQIEGEHGDEDRGAGKDRQPPGVEQEALAAVEHAAPADDVDAAQAEEAERGFEQDGLRRRSGVPAASTGARALGTTSRGQDGRLADAQAAHRVDELELLDAHHLAAHEARHLRPGQQRDDGHHLRQARCPTGRRSRPPG